MAVTIPRASDLVLIAWSRNPLKPKSPLRITAVRVIGSAKPCGPFLRTNGLLIRAIKCLKKNGFKIVCARRTTAVSGFVLLQRN